MERELVRVVGGENEMGTRGERGEGGESDVGRRGERGEKGEGGEGQRDASPTEVATTCVEKINRDNIFGVL